LPAEQSLSSHGKSTRKVTHFWNALSQLSAPRDNRGKKHDLGVVVLSFFLAILETTGHLNRLKIHRQMQNQHSRYQCFMDFKTVDYISYPQLGRILKPLHYKSLNSIFKQYFGRIWKKETQEWLALEGKELRGSIDKATGAKRGQKEVEKSAVFKALLPLKNLIKEAAFFAFLFFFFNGL
jgi:hypothetical protein